MTGVSGTSRSGISIHALLAESDLYGNQWHIECD